MNPTCPEVREELELYVLGALPAAREAELQRHLSSCPVCRAAEEDCRLLMDDLRLSVERAVPSPGFEQAVRSAAAAETSAERRRSRLRRALAAAAVALVSAGLAAAGGRWLAARALPRGPDAPAGGGALAASGGTRPILVRWQYQGARAAPASAAERLAIAGASLYVLRGEGTRARVVAVNAETGAVRWESASPSLGYLAADERRVYSLASEGGRIGLVALRASDGATLWRYAAGRASPLEPLSPPLPLADDRACWTVGGTIHMLDARDGRALWVRSFADEGAIGCAAAPGGNLYAVTGKALHLLAGRSGDELWGQRLDVPASRHAGALVALDGQRIYCAVPRADRGSELFCVDPATHRLAWRRGLPDARSLIASAGTVFVRGTRVLALDGATGRTLWACAAAGCGPLTYAGGLVHLADSGGAGRLRALDERTGRTAWEIDGLRSCDAFIQVGATGYVVTQNGVVHAIAISGPGAS